MAVTASNQVTLPPRPRRLLILEDDPRDAQLITRLLKHEDDAIEVEVIDSREIFEQRLKSSDLDVILADFNLREWTALEVLQIVQQSGQDIPVIVLTGSIGDEAAADCIKQGAADFVPKDRPAQMSAAVLRALEARRLREENRRASDDIARLATIVESSDDAIISKTLEGIITSWNKGAERLYGYTEAEVLGQPIAMLAPADRVNEVAQILARLKEGQRVEHYESVRVRKDGRRVDVSLSIFPLTGSRGVVTDAATIARDITERKRAEEKLRESETRFRLLFAGNPLPMWVYDLETLHFVEINDAAVAHYGYSREEFLRLRITDIRPTEDTHLLRKNLAQSREALEESGPWRHRLKDGRIILAQITSHLLSWNGRASALVVAQDITERARAELTLRESEERYRTLFERNLAGVIRTTKGGEILECNQAMADMLGYDSPGEVRKLRAPDLYVSPEERAKFLQKLEAEGRLSNYEARWRRKDGSPAWLIANDSLIQVPGGEPIIEGTLIDITERKRAEARLQEYEKAMEGLDEMIIVVDRDYRYVIANRAFLTYRGVTREQVLGRRVPDLLGKELFENTAKIRMDECFQGKMVKFEMRNKFPGLGERHLLVSYFPIEGPAGIDRIAGVLQDITERKRAEEALQRSQACLAAGERLTHSGSWSWNIASQGLYWSDETYRIFGFNPATDRSSLRDTFLARIHPEDRSRVEAGLQRPDLPDTVDYRIVLPDGTIRHIHDIAYPLTDAAGKPLERFGVACDVTERKRAQAALRESEERFRQIAETIDEVFWIADPHISTMLYISPAYERVWGRSCQSLYENPRSFLEAVYPEDRTRVLASLDAQKAGEAFDHEYRIVAPDGAVRWVWDRGFPIRDAAGQVFRFVGVAVDITERKHAEAERARLVTAIEQSDEAVIVTNPRGDIEYVNPAFTWITGYTREEAVRQNPRILKSDKQDTLFYQEIWATILSGKTWKGELINRRKDGSLYTEQMAITPVRDARGETTHFIATKQDVTERRTLEGQLQQAAKMEAVGRLAGGVAHDFNNLLTVINGYSELLLDSFPADHSAVGPLKEVKSAGERAASLTRQLLAFSRRQVLEPRVLDLNGVIANLEKMLRRLIGEDITLRTVLQAGLARVRADPGQIEQVLMNLVVNARDAMPRGGELTVETSNVELDETYARGHVTVKPGPHVMLAIADTGTGMTPETKAHIFEPFFTTKEQGKGTGLGLSTVYGIVKQSGGSIWVYSELGQGTVFKIYLPAVRGAAEDQQAMADAGSTSGTETILVVEDEEGVRSLIHQVLASAGYSVLVAGDAEKALAVCANYPGPIHLLLTDVVMPRLSGPLVAERVAAARPDVKVLFMSGYTDDAIVHHGVLSANMPFIQKPLSPMMLRKKIREVLDRK